MANLSFNLNDDIGEELSRRRTKGRRKTTVSMHKRVKASDLSSALSDVLSVYASDLISGVNEAGALSIKKLLKLTKANAPVMTGKFRDSIAIKTVRAKSSTGYETARYIWYVKPPNYRLTHLLVHGHATRNGGRTKANPFLKNALDAVLPEYERAVEEAVKEAGQSD